MLIALHGTAYSTTSGGVGCTVSHHLLWRSRPPGWSVSGGCYASVRLSGSSPSDRSECSLALAWTGSDLCRSSQAALLVHILAVYCADLLSLSLLPHCVGQSGANGTEAARTGVKSGNELRLPCGWGSVWTPFSTTERQTSRSWAHHRWKAVGGSTLRRRYRWARSAWLSVRQRQLRLLRRSPELVLQLPR